MAYIRERNGRYTVTVYCGKDMLGNIVRKAATFVPDPAMSKSKQEKALKEFAAEFELKIKSQFNLDANALTLRNFVEVWEAEYADLYLQVKTKYDYFKILEDTILPVLGNMKMSGLHPLLISKYIHSLKSDGVRKDGKSGGYSKNSIRKVFNVLSSVLRTAVEWEVIDQNPCDKVRLHLENDPEKLKYFTVQQANAFLEFIRQPYTVETKEHLRRDASGKSSPVKSYAITKTVPEQFQVLFFLAIYGGFRKGELLALKWTDIDFAADTVSVTKSVTMIQGCQVCKAPKTANSNRVVTIPHFLTEQLAHLKISQETAKHSFGKGWANEGWIFTQENGTNMNYSTPYHVFKDLLNRYNAQKAPGDQLPMIPFHGLRHTCATLLISNHIDATTVSARLGHAQTSTTMNIYSHVLHENDKIAANSLSSILVNS